MVDSDVSGNRMIVIDGMRHYEDITYWKEKSFRNFYLLYIEASAEICAMRYDEEDFQQANVHHVEQEIPSLREYADAIIDNNGTFEELYAQIDEFLGALY